MSLIKKPMLAETARDLSGLSFPILATPKLDGIRCLVINGQAVSRKFKPIPNHHIRKIIESQCKDGMDGEIICPGKTFNETQSLVMTEAGEPQFLYVIFDYVSKDLAEPYQDRINNLNITGNSISVLYPTPIQNFEALMGFEAQAIEDGYEGVMIRAQHGPYKCGRSTVKEGYLLKIKRFEDSEAEVIGFEEKLTNNNEATTDALGHTKRSSHKAHLEAAGTLGALLVRDSVSGIEFSIGTGFDDIQRKEIWDSQEAYLGKLVTYQHQPAGKKEKPRFPSFKGFRHKDDT